MSEIRAMVPSVPWDTPTKATPLADIRRISQESSRYAAPIGGRSAVSPSPARRLRGIAAHKPRRILNRNAHGRPTDRRSFDRYVTRMARRLRVQKKNATVPVMLFGGMLDTGERVRPQFNARTVATARAVMHVIGKTG